MVRMGGYSFDGIAKRQYTKLGLNKKKSLRGKFEQCAELKILLNHLQIEIIS